MPIPIITRTNTIDEWRIQTNLEATALNNLETGAYTKSNGTLNLTGNSSLILTASGTSLQVSNGALFQSNVSIGRDVSVGQQGTAIGNVTIAGVTTLLGPGSGLLVANNATVNLDLQIARTVYAGNVYANNYLTVGKDATISGILRVEGSGDKLYVNTGVAKINTATITDLTSTNTRIENARINDETVNTSYVLVGTTIRGNVVNLTSSTANVQTLNVVIGTTIQGNVVTLKSNVSTINTALINVATINTATIGNSTVTGSETIGLTLTVTGNTTSGNLTTSNTTRTGSLVVNGSSNVGGSIYVTSNTQTGNLVSLGHTQTATLRTSGVANVGSGLTVTGNESVSGTLTVTGNTSTTNIVNSLHTQTATLRTSGVANVGSGLTVTGNTNTTNIVNSSHIQSSTLRTSGVANVGSGLTVTGNTTSGNIDTTGLTTTGNFVSNYDATINRNFNVNGGTTLSTTVVNGQLLVDGNFVLTGATILDTNIFNLRANTPQPYGIDYSYIGVNRGEGTLGSANANSYIRWNEESKYWDIRDVDNPTSYSKILTANLISDSLDSINSSTLASSNSVNTLNVRIETTNTNLKIYTDNLVATSNNNLKLYVDGINSNLSSEIVTANTKLKAYTDGINSNLSSAIVTANNSLKSYVDANLTLRATSSNSYALTTITTANNNLKAYVDGADSNLSSAIVTANTRLKAYTDGTMYAKTGGTISGNVIINGDLNVSGNVTYINSTQVQIGDNIITLNADINPSATPTENAGLEVDRGVSPNTLILWNESSDKWTFTNDGTNYQNIGSESGISQADQRAVTSGVYANSSYLHANAAYVSQNTTGVYANTAYLHANAAYVSQNTTGVYANSSYLHANAAYVSQNTTGVYANAAFALANTRISSVTIINGTGISGGTTGNTFTLSIGQNVSTTSNVQFFSMGVGTSAPSVSGEVSALGTLYAYRNSGGQVTVGDSVNGSLEIGLPGRATAGSPYVDFHSSANSPDYDFRMQVTGGSTTPGTGSLTMTGAGVRIPSLGIGTTASGTTGEIRATNNITAYYSDERLKNKLGNIENALDKLMQLSGFYYEANDVAQELGYDVKREVGVSAQEVQKVMPEVVAPAPIDDKYLTVRYERLVPLLIESIKELKREIDSLKNS